MRALAKAVCCAASLLAADTVAGGTNSAASPPGLDLPQSLDLALAQNRDLIRLALRLESALLSEKGARADFQPTLRPAGGGGVGANENDLEYGASVLKKYSWGTGIELNGRVLTREVSGIPDPYNRGVVKVEVSQPLFKNAGPLVNLEGIRQAESGVMAARRAVEMKKTDLSIAVVQMYEDLLRGKRQMESDERSVGRLGRLLRLTQARARQGRATRVDALRIELQVGQAEARLETSRTQYLSLQQDFANLLGEPPATRYELAPAPEVDLDVPGVDEAVAVALQNRLDYAQVLQDYQDARRGVKIARHFLLPDLELVSSYERYDEGSNLSQALALGEDVWFVGLRATTDFPQRQERIALQQAELDEKTLVENIRDAENLARIQVFQRRLAYLAALTDERIARKNLAVAHARMRMAKKRFEMGKGDSFTVSDAENEYMQAEFDFLKTQAGVSVAGCRLLRDMGTLIAYPEDLKPPEAPVE